MEKGRKGEEEKGRKGEEEKGRRGEGEKGRRGESGEKFCVLVDFDYICYCRC
jgi:hypothetical protein